MNTKGVIVMANKVVGASVKQYMLENGISQTFVSLKTGIPTNVLNAALNSKRKLLAEEYFLICGVLGVPLDTFNQKLTKAG